MNNEEMILRKHNEIKDKLASLKNLLLELEEEVRILNSERKTDENNLNYIYDEIYSLKQKKFIKYLINTYIGSAILGLIFSLTLCLGFDIPGLTALMIGEGTSFVASLFSLGIIFKYVNSDKKKQEREKKLELDANIAEKELSRVRKLLQSKTKEYIELLDLCHTLEDTVKEKEWLFKAQDNITYNFNYALSDGQDSKSVSKNNHKTRKLIKEDN